MTPQRRRYHREWKRRKHGHQPRKQLTYDQRMGIRTMVASGLKQKSVAIAYGISQQLVSKIARL